MDNVNHKIKIKYKDFEFELEGERDFVENNSKDITSFLTTLIMQPQKEKFINTKTSGYTQMDQQPVSIPIEEKRKISIGEFIQSKNFKTDYDLILGIAYYLETYEDTESFTSKDVVDYLRTAKQSVPKNTPNCIAGNIKKGLLMQMPDKRENLMTYQLTFQGQEFVNNYVGAEKKINKPKKSVKLKDIDLDILNISIDDLNLDKYINIRDLTRTQDLALIILKIYSIEKGIEYLSAAEIVAILKTKFSIVLNEPQIVTSLNRSKPKVEVLKVNKINKYKIMAQGDRYLLDLFEKEKELV